MSSAPTVLAVPSKRMIPRKLPPSIDVSHSTSDTDAIKSTVDEVASKLYHLSPTVTPLTATSPYRSTVHGARADTRHVTGSKFHGRDLVDCLSLGNRHDPYQKIPHYHKRASLTHVDMSLSGSHLPGNTTPVDSAYAEPETFPIVLPQQSDRRRSVLSPTTNMRSLSFDHTSMRNSTYGFQERELPPLPTGIGYSNLSPVTTASDIQTAQLTRTGAQAHTSFCWPSRSTLKPPLSQQLWTNGEPPIDQPSQLYPPSQDTAGMTPHCAPAVRQGARKNIRQIFNKFTSAFISSPVHVTADELWTEPDLSEEPENILPTQAQLSIAASLDVISEDGIRIPFGDLWLGQRTIVCFIRHFWCPSCQDYMHSISKVYPAILRQAEVNLVIISNGSYKMIKAYRRIFRAPFALYVDTSLQVYHALGMTLRTINRGPDCERGEYIQHGALRGVAMVVGRAAKVRMPIWENGGDIRQLGGEFVLGPGLQCNFAHRMHTTRSHTRIEEVLDAAGIHMATTWGRSWLPQMQ